MHPTGTLTSIRSMQVLGILTGVRTSVWVFVDVLVKLSFTSKQ